MLVVSKNIQNSINNALLEIKGKPGSCFGLYFHLSKLHQSSYSPHQEKIVLNLLGNHFGDKEGHLFALTSKDVIVIYNGDDRALVDRIVFKLRHLFAEDPLAMNLDGSENPQFCSIYLINYQWEEFYDLCVNPRSSNSTISSTILEHKETALFDFIDYSLGTIDIFSAIKNQGILAIPAHNPTNTRVLFYEIYVSIMHVKKLIPHDVGLLANNKLFRYFTEKLDVEVLKIMKDKISQHSELTFSLNLNVSTILSESFHDFTQEIFEVNKPSVIIEIDLGDVFCDINAYVTAHDYLKQWGYKVCLDGLNDLSFLQVDRESLGFDLAKLQWNSQHVHHLSNEENAKLVSAVEKYGPKRIILTRCDNNEAIKYGQCLGISLFQGWHIDNMREKNSLIL
jgi:EAL domain-containing protein (putative c-di-GMP-specific phosphodiesterase class I)